MAIELRRTDEVAAVLLVALSAGVFLVSREFPEGLGGVPGAAFFPRIIAATVALLAVVLFVRGVATDEERTHRISLDAVERFAVPLAFLVAYVALMPVLGFVLDTVAFLVAVMRYSGVTVYRRSLPLGVGLAVVLHYVFGELLHIPLPEGSLISVSQYLPSLPLFAGVG